MGADAVLQSTCGSFLCQGCPPRLPGQLPPGQESLVPPGELHPAGPLPQAPAGAVSPAPTRALRPLSEHLPHGAHEAVIAIQEPAALQPAPEGVWGGGGRRRRPRPCRRGLGRLRGAWKQLGQAVDIVLEPANVLRRHVQCLQVLGFGDVPLQGLESVQNEAQRDVEGP